MDSPAMLLMEFQREARSHFTAEVASVLVDVLLRVEQGAGQCTVRLLSGGQEYWSVVG